MISCFVFVACETAHIVRYVLALEQTLTFSDARRAFLPPPREDLRRVRERLIGPAVISIGIRLLANLSRAPPALGLRPPRDFLSSTKSLFTPAGKRAGPVLKH